MSNKQELPAGTVDRGSINPKTGEPWLHPNLATYGDFFVPFPLYVDLMKGWENLDDDSWYMRPWPFTRNTDTFPIGFVSPEKIPCNDKFMTRLMDYWEIKKSDLNDVTENVWPEHIKNSLRTLNETLSKRDMSLSHTLFTNLHSSTLCHGMQQGYQAHFWIANFNEVSEKRVRLIYDRMISLAEFVEVMPTYCPEQGGLPTELNPDVILPAILHVIKRTVGLNHLRFPVYQGGLIGAYTTTCGIVDERILDSLYTAVKIHRLLKGNRASAICDLGAGNGLIIFWLYQFGYTNLYTADLPHINLVQGFFLGTEFGYDQIKFVNETHNAPIKILSMNDFFNYGFDLVINVDSLPEIDKSWATRYLDHISQSVDIFYSINHETTVQDQMHVSKTIRENYPNLVSLGKSRNWMRPGYVEDVFVQK